MVTHLFNSKLVSPLEEFANNSPEKIVFISKDRTLTAKELFSESKTIAVNLTKKGFSPGDVVVIVVEPGLEFLELMYALLMLHAKIAIVDPEMGKENYAAKIKQLSPKWMFVDSRLLFLADWPIIKKIANKIRKNLPDINFSTLNSHLIKVGRNLPLKLNCISFKSLIMDNLENTVLEKTDTAYDNVIVYTSGTLDVPKGVLHSDKSISKTIELLKEIIAGDKNDIVGTYLPHFMLLGVASGLVVKIMPTEMSAAIKLDWIKRQQINILFGPPSEMLPLIIYCETKGHKFPSCIKHLMLGSAPVHQGFLKRLLAVMDDSVKITCTYGMTEHLLVAIADGREKVQYSGEGDLLGKIVKGVNLKIMDDGEIFVKSDQIFTRYFHMNDRPEWHSTGDLGKLDKDGNLVLLGRKKEMIIRKDFNIYPALYEGTIKKIPGINEAAFVGIYDDQIHDEIVYLAIDSNNVSENELKDLLAKGKYSIDKQALPDKIFNMQIPRKGRQDKIDRTAIIKYIKVNNL